jgi:hypothetical protein
MGFLDIECAGCTQKLPPEQVTEGPPKDGHVRNIGTTFNGIFICYTCWNNAQEKGFNLDRSKEEVKRWKEYATPLKEQQVKEEAKKRDDFEKLDEQEKRRLSLEEASMQMRDELSPEVNLLVRDILLPNEKIIYTVRSSPTGNRSQLVLTNMNLILINKGLRGGQGQDAEGFLGTLLAIGKVSIRIYPISEIRSVEIQPLQGASTGHFQVLTNATSEKDNESKFLFDTHTGYYESILLYRKIREMQTLQTASRRPQQVSPPPAPSRSTPPKQ